MSHQVCEGGPGRGRGGGSEGETGAEVKKGISLQEEEELSRASSNTSCLNFINTVRYYHRLSHYFHTIQSLHGVDVVEYHGVCVCVSKKRN